MVWMRYNGHVGFLLISLKSHATSTNSLSYRTVSMTHGRPCMTAHLPEVPLPGISLEQTQENEMYTSIITFYVANIKLHRVLNEILSEVYDTLRGQPSEAIKSDEARKQCSLDVIIRLEEKLSSYETQLPSFLNWKSPVQPDNERSLRQMAERQRNVLHARYLSSLLHLRNASDSYIIWLDISIFVSCSIDLSLRNYVQVTLTIFDQRLQRTALSVIGPLAWPIAFCIHLLLWNVQLNVRLLRSIWFLWFLIPTKPRLQTLGGTMDFVSTCRFWISNGFHVTEKEIKY